MPISSLFLSTPPLPRLLVPLLNPRNSKNLPFRSIPMAWTCAKCTFINPSSQISNCQICGTFFSSSSSSPTLPSSSSSFSPPQAPKWSCKACTFLNLFRSTSCEICGTSASASSLSAFEELMGPENDSDSTVGSVFLPLRRCSKRKDKDPDSDSVDTGGFRGIKSLNNAMHVLEDTNEGAKLTTLKIMTYNVWFREDLEVFKRMKAIGDLIEVHCPDVICFQEVTPNIYDIFQKSSWWKRYKCPISSEMANEGSYFCMQLSKLPVKSFSSKPFSNSMMGRELCIAEVAVEASKPLVVATSHLESPCPGPPTWDQMFSKERVVQAKEAIDFLKNNPNVIFCGDMNWDDKLDGQFPIPKGYVDAWAQLKPGQIGWTYDTKSNQMLSGNRTLQKRLDRFICGLRDFKLTGIDMIGTEAIPGLSYCKEKRMKGEMRTLVLPVLPSDHYGLLLTMTSL